MPLMMESLTALGRAHVGFCEQLAWFALESCERAHRLNMDAFESFWARRMAEARAAVGAEAAPASGSTAADALIAHWTRMSESASYLCQEFGRMAAEYADGLKAAASAAPDDAVPAAPNQGRRAQAPGSAGGALAKAA
ncbi:MAG: hypothetical protein U1F45_13985 [Burkholderiales bacterium]